MVSVCVYGFGRIQEKKIKGETFDETIFFELKLLRKGNVYELLIVDFISHIIC